MATAMATQAPTIDSLPMPMRPITSTCACTDEEAANVIAAIRLIVSAPDTMSPL